MQRWDLAIPLLDIYTEETRIERDTCTPMFISALFTIVRIWKQPRCPLTEEWTKKMWHVYIVEYYSAIEKNEIMPFAATWMDLESVTLSEVSQTEKEKYRMTSLTCGIEIAKDEQNMNTVSIGSCGVKEAIK